VCGGYLANFKLSDFVQPATMPIGTAESGAKEIFRTIPRNRDTHGAASEAEDIQVIILHPLACRKVIVTERRACAPHLIGSHGSTHAAATYENAALHFSVGHSASEGECKIRVIVARVIYFIAEIDDVVAFGRKQLGELLLHFESAMICAYAHFHLVLLFSPELAAEQSGSLPQLQFFPR
jgi:hypothetical protein